MENTQVKKRGKLGPILITAAVLLIVALVGVVAVVGFLGVQMYGYLTYEPMYEATATLCILKQSDENDQDYDSVQKVAKDCEHLLKSHSVLYTVIEELDLDMSYDKLRDSISIDILDIYIFTVTVQAETPELAKHIADCVCYVGVDKINEAMGYNQVIVFENGIININPVNERFNIFRLLGF